LVVRIGVHAGEATRRGQDFGGSEVHKAARIAAAADGGEILASREALDGTDDDFTITDVGDVALKGFADPVAVGRVIWQ
jgi:class 3 adenylate cyclase